MLSSLVFAVVILLVVSAIASGTEAALFAIPLSKVEAFVEQKRRGADALQQIKNDMLRTITTVVVINNIANIVGSIMVGGLAASVFQDASIGVERAVAVFSGLLTFCVIAFSEIVPKSVGEKRSETIALFMAGPLIVITKLFTPVLWLLDFVTKPFTKLGGSGIAVTSEAEIKALTELGEKAGIIDREESELIHNVFELAEMEAGDIMTPLAKVDYLQANDKIENLRERITQLTHTRLPVIDGTFDKLEGVVHLRTLLQALAEGRTRVTVRDLMSPPTFIPLTSRGDDMLKHFRKTKQHLAIVVDAFGTMMGVLTLEDVLEILVGDIVDETDKEQDDIKEVSPGVIEAVAEAYTLDVNDAIFVNLPDMRVGELIIDELGRIPVVNETFTIGDAQFTVMQGTPRAIDLVQIKKIELNDKDDDVDITKEVASEVANLIPSSK